MHTRELAPETESYNRFALELAPSYQTSLIRGSKTREQKFCCATYFFAINRWCRRGSFAPGACCRSVLREQAPSCVPALRREREIERRSRKTFSAPLHQTPSRRNALPSAARACDSKVNLLTGYCLSENEFLISCRNFLFCGKGKNGTTPRSKIWGTAEARSEGMMLSLKCVPLYSKHNRLRPEPIRLVRRDSEHAQSDGKSVNHGLPLLDMARGRPEVAILGADQKERGREYETNTLCMLRKSGLTKGLNSWCPVYQKVCILWKLE